MEGMLLKQGAVSSLVLQWSQIRLVKESSQEVTCKLQLERAEEQWNGKLTDISKQEPELYLVSKVSRAGKQPSQGSWGRVWYGKKLLANSRD